MGAVSLSMVGIAAPASASLIKTAARAGMSRGDAQPAGRLALKALSFSPARIDASAGGAVATITWTVTDSNQNATSVTGNVYIRMAGSEPGTFAGQTYQVMYALDGAPNGEATTVSGTAQESSYSFDFAVPQYASATTAKWVVTKVTAQDDQGEALSLSGDSLGRFARTVTATELADSKPPRSIRIRCRSMRAMRRARNIQPSRPDRRRERGAFPSSRCSTTRPTGPPTATSTWRRSAGRHRHLRGPGASLPVRGVRQHVLPEAR